MTAAYRVCRRCGGGFYPMRASHWLCRACWRHGHRRSRITPDAELLLRAISLCHPDRHPAERRDEATRTTQELLAAREELGA
ncbi:MAG: hypothetical protein ACRDMH_02465 [Solirubrobacterales bacterium]